MSPDKYECEVCGSVFNSAVGRGNHRASHTNEEIREVLISELKTVNKQLGHTPTAEDMNECGTISPSTYTNYFDSWNDALQAANLGINQQHKFSKQALIDEINQLAEELDHPPERREMDEYGKISSGPYLDTFDSWNSALRVAGFEPNYQTDISRQELISELQRLTKEIGSSPTQEDMLNHGKFSFRPYVDTFNSWNEALRAAGLEVNSRYEIPEEELIDGIKEFSDELGHTPSFTEMDKRGPFSPNTYIRKFESWNQALQLAGLDINSRQNISETELEHEIKRLAEELGRPPERREMDKYGRFSSTSYRSKFGSWNDALRAIGLEPSRIIDISESKLQSALKQFAKELGHTPSYAEMDDKGPFSAGRYVREFGSWNEAVQTAGIEINNQREISASELKTQLNQLAERLGRPPSMCEMKNKGDFSTGPYIAEFGSWNKALQAANLEIYQHREIPRSELKSGLQQLADEINGTPTQMDMENRGPFSHNAYIRAFGSWNEALRATGLEVQFNPDISETELLEALQRLAEDLGRPPMRTEMNSNGLFSAGPYIRQFGSWEAALTDAGLDPDNVPNGIYYPDHLEHKVRSTIEQKVAELLISADVEYKYESRTIEYLDSYEYVPDFVTDNYIIEVKGTDWGEIYNKEVTDREKAKSVMRQIENRDFVVVGERIPADIHIPREEYETLYSLFS
jgi:SOS-response transcriptional repressor LexA